MTYQEILSKLKSIPNLKTKDVDSFNKELIKNNKDVSDLKDHILKDQILHRTYFQVMMGLLKSNEERFIFIEENEDLLQDWWHVDQLIQFFKKPLNYEDTIKKAQKYVNSKKSFVRRLGYVIFISGLQKNKNNTAKILSLIENDDSYYVQMGQAWLIADLAIYNVEEVKSFITLNEKKIKYNILGKSIQKILDSRRINDETKNYLKSLRGELKKVI